MKKFILFLLMVALKSFSQPWSYDTSFGTSGIGQFCENVNEPSVSIDAGMQSTGKIVMLNYDFQNVARLIRWNANGSIDNSFGANGVLNITVTPPFEIGGYYNSQMVIQPDDKIIFMGLKQSNAYPNSYWVVRLLPNGALDTSFNNTGYLNFNFGSIQDRGVCVGLQPDGKIIVGGTSGDTGQFFSMARLNTNGSFDTSFGTSGRVQTSINGQEAFANRIVVQPDGKIILGGYAVTTAQAKDFAMVRYNTNGTIDTSFGLAGKVITTLTNFSDIILSMFVEPNGKIVAGGTYSYEINPRMAMVRYNSNGSIDNSFGTNGKVVDLYGYQRGCSITRQIDGKIIMASGWDGIALYLSRYNSNGIQDTTFGTNGVVDVLPPVIGNGYASKVFIQADNKIVVTSSFSSSSGAGCPTVVRLNPGLLSQTSFERGFFEVYPNPAKDILYLNTSNKDSKYQLTIYSLLGQQVASQKTLENNTKIDISFLAKGSYIVRLQNGDNYMSKIIIKE